VRTVPTLALVVVALLTACSADEPAGAGTSATHTGWLRDRQASGTIVIDPALLLSGQKAIEAARIDRHLPSDGTLPNDFYVDDDEAVTVEYRVAQNVVVALYDCATTCELQPVAADAFLDGRVEPHGGSNALVSLVLRGDEVVRISEIYLP